jgi:putative transcriptional regulator
MSVTHHPGDELLWAHAGGTGSLAQSLLISCHLSYCPHCRNEVAILEALGGALLNDAPPQPLADNALQTAMTRLNGASVAKPEQSSLSIARPVPPPLRRFVGADLDRVRWRRVTRGLSYRMLLKRGGARVYLTKSAPGSGIGLHTHKGNELTLVLAGGFSDEAGSYTEGDIVLTTPDINHTPVADDDGDCITLAMTDAPLKFRSVGAGLVARIFGF